MKLHSDSVIDKLEDKEKEVDRLEKRLRDKEMKIDHLEDNWRIEVKSKEEENAALKRALENKIDSLITVEKQLKEAKDQLKSLDCPSHN